MVQEYLNAPLRERNSFGIDARAARLAEFDSAESLCEYLARTPRTTGRTAVIGGGNNILFTGDFDGLLLHPVGRACRIDARGGDRVAVHAEAGLPWDDFVRLCTENGLWGAENLTAIPGTVGAAPVQNIGAYGAEAADIIESVEVIDLLIGAVLFDDKNRDPQFIDQKEFIGGQLGKVFDDAFHGEPLLFPLL